MNETRAIKSEDKNTLITLVRGPIVSTTKSINNEAVPAIGLAYISAYLKAHGYQTKIVDAVVQGLATYTTLEEFPGYQIQGLSLESTVASIPRDSKVIGFSTMFSGEWPVNRKLIQMVRAAFPDALLIAGGEHITALAEYSMTDCPELDLCVLGEGEHTMYEAVEAWRTGQAFEHLPAVAYRDKDGTPRRSLTLERIREIDGIPWPDWPEGYLEQFWAAGKSYGILSEKDMPILASRGCPYQCTFCSNPQMWTTRYILRDIDDLIAEIKMYVTKYGISALQFYDLTAITKKKWTIEFCQRLLAEGINLRWSLPSGTRSEALDAESLNLLRKSGCNYLVYAPESGSEETLQIIKKRIEKESFTASVREALRQGLTLRTNLIIGFPHETRRHVFQTIRYGLYLAMVGVDEVSINIFSPYPGTEIFRALSDEGKLPLSDRYFLQLTSLNSDYTHLNPLAVNPNMGQRELAVYRLGFMMANYMIGYLFYPKRIVRTIRNIFSTVKRQRCSNIGCAIWSTVAISTIGCNKGAMPAPDAVHSWSLLDRFAAPEPPTLTPFNHERSQSEPWRWKIIKRISA